MILLAMSFLLFLLVFLVGAVLVRWSLALLLDSRTLVVIHFDTLFVVRLSIGFHDTGRSTALSSLLLLDNNATSTSRWFPSNFQTLSLIHVRVGVPQGDLRVGNIILGVFQPGHKVIVPTEWLPAASKVGIRSRFLERVTEAVDRDGIIERLAIQLIQGDMRRDSDTPDFAVVRNVQGGNLTHGQNEWREIGDRWTNAGYPESVFRIGGIVSHSVVYR